MSSVFGKNGKGFLAQSGAALFSLFSITCQSLRKPASCLLGFHTLVLSLSDVRTPLNYLIEFNGTHLWASFKLWHSSNDKEKKDWLVGEDVQTLKTCCRETWAFSAVSQFGTVSRKRFKKTKKNKESEIKWKILLFKILWKYAFLKFQSYPVYPPHAFQRPVN